MREDLASCQCRGAVVRAYRELRARDETDMSAFNSATRVYLWHHPEASEHEARYTIAEWLDDVT